MEKIVRKLGRFRIHTSVKDESVTHVVCGAARRTMNVLCAISRGLWLLSKEWVNFYIVDNTRLLIAVLITNISILEKLNFFQD